MKTFKGMNVLREAKGSDVSGTLVIEPEMEDLAGYDFWSDNIVWLGDVTDLPVVTLILLCEQGYVIVTDETPSEVWLVSKNNVNSKARLIYQN